MCETRKQIVESIKLATGTFQYKSISVPKTMIDSIRYLYSLYNLSKDEKYIELATAHIYAYLDMGFPYGEEKGLFDDILQLSGENKEIYMDLEYKNKRRIPLTKMSIRNLIGRWPASPKQDMKIGQVVEDIINKVMNHEIGVYHYQSVVTKESYELIVEDDESIFHNFQTGKFYLMENKR